MADLYAGADGLFDADDFKNAYNELKKIYDSNSASRQDVELLWRLARACHTMSKHIADPAAKKKILLEGQKYAQDGYKINAEHFEVVKYAAMTTALIADKLPMKERIEQGFVFKSYLDKALSLNAHDQMLFHLRGRFSFNVAKLTWIERKIADTFFATPPTGTFDEAINDYLEVEKIVPGTWIENLLHLAKAYVETKEKKTAVTYLQKAVKLTPTDDAEKEALDEAKTLLTKLSKK